MSRLTLVSSRNRASVHDVLQQALVSKKTISYELEFDTKERRTRYLMFNASTKRNKDNLIIEVMEMGKILRMLL